VRNAKLDADNLNVAISDGTVTLSGTVRSWPRPEGDCPRRSRSRAHARGARQPSVSAVMFRSSLPPPEHEASHYAAHITAAPAGAG
jgi:hypothetical protein